MSHLYARTGIGCASCGRDVYQESLPTLPAMTVRVSCSYCRRAWSVTVLTMPAVEIPYREPAGCVEALNAQAEE